MIEMTTSQKFAQIRETALREIAFQLEAWIIFDKRQRDRENLETTDDTNIISPPVWPSHGQLKEWIRVLRDSQ